MKNVLVQYLWIFSITAGLLTAALLLLPEKKNRLEFIEDEIKKGYSPIYFMDDSKKNIDAVNKLKKKYPEVKLVTKLVKAK